MSEKELEKRLVEQVRAVGGCAYKFVSPGMSGVPDRLVVLPEGKVGFVEVKRKGEKPRAQQQFQMERLSNLGCKVYVLDDERGIGYILTSISGEGV